ncbi:MAG: hypothetical protein NC910_01100 [Candidatus Omnitrophica bacterium]|nr:hypothetical protein [Candidatus Omnitrophota bacterium]
MSARKAVAWILMGCIWNCAVPVHAGTFDLREGDISVIPSGSDGVKPDETHPAFAVMAIQDAVMNQMPDPVSIEDEVFWKAATQAVAAFLHVDPAEIQSIHVPFPGIEHSPVDVEMHDGRHFIGELSSSMMVTDPAPYDMPSYISYEVRVHFLIDSNAGIGTIHNIAGYLGISSEEIAGIRVSDVQIAVYPPPPLDVTVTLKDGAEYTGTLSPAYFVGPRTDGTVQMTDALGYLIYRVDYLEVVGPDEIPYARLIAEYLGISADQIESVDVTVVNPGDKMSPLHVQVKTKDGKEYAGQLVAIGIAIHPPGDKNGVGPDTVFYGVDWLIESNINAGGVMAIAEHLEVDVREISSVRMSWDDFAAEVRLRDGSRFIGQLVVGVVDYFQGNDGGYFYGVDWFVRVSGNMGVGFGTVQNIAGFLGINASEIASVETPELMIAVWPPPKLPVAVILRSGAEYKGELFYPYYRYDQPALTVVEGDPGDMWWPYPVDSLGYVILEVSFLQPASPYADLIAEYLGISADRIEAVEVTPVYPRDPMSPLDVRAKTTDGKLYVGRLIVVGTAIHAPGDPVNGVGPDTVFYGVDWLVESNLEADAILTIADYLKIDVDSLVSVIGARGAPLSVEVRTADGKTFVGNLAILVVDYLDGISDEFYFVDWLVESAVGIGTVRNIAAHLGIQPRDLALITGSFPRILNAAATIQVILKDGRRFIGRISSHNNGEIDEFGDPVYRVVFLIQTNLDMESVARIAVFLGIGDDRISSIHTEAAFGGLATEVNLREGARFIGILFSSDGGFSYKVSWLVSVPTEIGVSTVKNIAAAIGVGPERFSAITIESRTSTGHLVMRVRFFDGTLYRAKLAPRARLREYFGTAVWNVTALWKQHFRKNGSWVWWRILLNPFPVVSPASHPIQ